MTYDDFLAVRRTKENERQGHFKKTGGKKKKNVSVSDIVCCLAHELHWLLICSMFMFTAMVLIMVLLIIMILTVTIIITVIIAVELLGVINT